MVKPEEEIENGDEEQKSRTKHKGKHDKLKPWDDDPNIDHWKIEKFDPSWNEGGLLKSAPSLLSSLNTESFVLEKCLNECLLLSPVLLKIQLSLWLYFVMVLPLVLSHFLLGYLLGVLPKGYRVPSMEVLKQDKFAEGRVDFLGFEFLKEVLNAKLENVDREAEIVAQSGRLGSITIATNMAGRGTDIKAT